MPPPQSHVLTINGGSSSIKFSLFDAAPEPLAVLRGAVERIGLPGTVLSAEATDDALAEKRGIEAPDPRSAAERVADFLERRIGPRGVAAIAHRVVHGGPKFFRPTVVTPQLVGELQAIVHLDPAHLPVEIALIEAFARRLPGVPQVACFDTAFAHDMPRVAQLLPIPRRYESAGVRRYGFHGLSYEFLMQELHRVAGPGAAGGRVILAHLGGGASMAAVRAGKCIETSMGFTPTGGLVMGTRSGDLDPGVLLHLMRTENLGAAQLDELVNRRSGMIGVSETSSDMRDLLARRSSDPRAADAVALFCHQARKWIGAFAAALGGVDTLIFSGGIGAHSPEVRAEICGSLGFLGIEIDAPRNAAGQAVISAGGTCTVRVMQTNEERILAGAAMQVIRQQQQ